MRDYEIISTLSSKVKTVCKVASCGEIFILKEYPTCEDALKEAQIVNSVAMTGYAPKVIECEGNKALYEYIDGESFYDSFRLATMTDDAQSMELLATRLSIFLQMIYSLTDCVMKDIDFRNYIVKDGRVIGVDFSQVDNGMPYEDLASAIVFALISSVGEYYDSFPFVQKLLECFKLTMFDVINEVKSKLEKVNAVARDKIDMDIMKFAERLKAQRMING